ncbi:MAG: DUF2220 family protein [Thiohalocapsa sp.]|uniref:Wadjet anti-phage system protein JetD domain-containing protein n=1 Tax=Thiohalocapsa sp. TaxID=2497641 RepID=UPI0025F5421F|nr:DUF3322 and DUF2220 domain-containing protein [Thiohalocapsa sp.]MCG6940864.1 DUF2220 family protein [Thiohalocapsa sp.]
MTDSRRLDPGAVAALLRRRWNGQHRRWLDGDGSWPLTILLHAPTERETARDLAGVRDWIERWAAATADAGRPGELIWTERQWPGLGRQRLPERLLLAGPAQVAAWVHEQARWALACERAASVRRLLVPATGLAGTVRSASRTVHRAPGRDEHLADTDAPARAERSAERTPRRHDAADPDAPGSSAPAGEQEQTLRVPSPDPALCDDRDRAASPDQPPQLGRHFSWLAEAPPADFERLLAVLRWLIDHADSGLYIRQLPIPGIDTKWVGANRGRLVDLLAQHQRRQAGAGASRETDLHRLAGLRREPDLMRLRILDPALRAATGGLGDITAPIEQIAALPLQPARVFIVENLQTGLAFDDLPGAVCCMARGYAVDAFAAIPWLRDRPVHYWGDLDTHGFAILNRLRQYLPDARSLLMDADTLLRHRDLWQREDKPAAGPLEHLTAAEHAVFESLLTDRWGERVRLEQERIDWDHAWQQVRSAGD